MCSRDDRMQTQMEGQSPRAWERYDGKRKEGEEESGLAIAACAGLAGSPGSPRKKSPPTSHAKGQAHSQTHTHSEHANILVLISLFPLTTTRL